MSLLHRSVSRFEKALHTSLEKMFLNKNKYRRTVKSHSDENAGSKGLSVLEISLFLCLSYLCHII